MTTRRRPLRRPNMRRAVILFPSGLTLGNLFFGIFAIIAASRREFVEAGVYVLLGGACDALDGQVARATNAGTQFGEELDSLVDAITFGLAPGMIMFFAVFRPDSFDWLSVFLFTACAVMRLARFNIEQAGTAKTYFQGLPSPAAGITLASYYWFSQSWLYNYGAIANLKWHVLLRFLMAALSFLMISNIPYPVFPRTGFRSLRALGATLLLVGSMTLLATKRLEFFFPAALCYVAWGPIRWMFAGLFERRQPTIPYDLSEGEDDEDEEDAFGPMDSQVHAMRQSEREPRAALVDRERARRDRPDRAERPARTKPERPATPARGVRTDATPSARTDRGDTSVRPTGERAARGERGERSEADRAARREKRDKRDKRREREARAAATSPAEPPETGVGAITLGGSDPDLAAATPVLSVVRAEVEPVAPGESAEGQSAEAGPARKRKRRRRRGQRDRTGADVGAGSSESSDAGDGAEAGDAGDGGDLDDAPDSGERSPYASTERHASEPRAEPEPPRVTRAPEPAAPSPPPSASSESPPAPPSSPFTDNNE